MLLMTQRSIQHSWRVCEAVQLIKFGCCEGVAGEYWLGNEVIHQMTSEDYSLRVSLTDWNDVTLDVDYDHFRVTDEADGYRLYVAGYRERAPSAGDSLLKHNGRRFSTFDVDNDQVGREFEHGSCARRFTGAWWYYRCYMSNLNGRYYAAGNVPDRRFDGIAWKSWTGSRYSLKRVEMKIRPARAGHD